MVGLCRSARLESPRSFCSAIIADGTLRKLALHLRNRQGLQVRSYCTQHHIISSYNLLFSAQLQKFEDSAPDSLEFERLKEHFEPILRASSSTSAAVPSAAAHSHHIHSNSITAAANAALARDIPGVGRYHPTSSRAGRSSANKDRSKNKDEMPEYKSRLDIATASNLGSGGGEVDREFMKHLETVSEVAALEQRWENSWATSLKSR
jgi:dynactin 4